MANHFMEIEWLSSFLDYIKTGIDKNLSEYIISLNGKKTLSYQIALCVLSFPLKSAAISSIASEIDSALSMAQEEGFDKISKELIDEMNSFMFPSPSELNSAILKGVNISPKYLLKPDLLEKAKNPQKLLRRQLITLAAALCCSGDGNGGNNQCSYFDYLLFRMSPEGGARDVLLKSANSNQLRRYLQVGNVDVLSEACEQLSDRFLFTHALKSSYLRDRSNIESWIQATILALEAEPSQQDDSLVSVVNGSKEIYENNTDLGAENHEEVQAETNDGASGTTSDLFATKDELLEYVARSKLLSTLYRTRNEKKPTSPEADEPGGKYIADTYYDKEKRSWTLLPRSNSISAMIKSLAPSDFKHIRSGHDRCTPQMLTRVFNVSEKTAMNYSSQINRTLNL